MLKLAKIREAIENENIVKVNELEAWYYLPEIIYYDGLDLGRALFEMVDLNKLDVGFFLNNAFNDRALSIGVSSDIIQLLCEFYGSDNIVIFGDEIYYNLMQYPDESLKVIKTCTELDVKFDYLECFYSSGRYIYDEHFYYLTKCFEFENEDYVEFFENLLISSATDRPEYTYTNVATLIKQLITTFDVDVNLNGLGDDFDYAAHQCLFCYPYAIKYFFTKQFDVSIIEDEEFWKEFCDVIEDNVQYYPIAFQQIKESGVKFNDTIMIDALKLAGHDLLIHAYLN